MSTKKRARGEPKQETPHDSRESLLSLLQTAGGEALALGEYELTQVITSLWSALEADELAGALTTKSNTTMLGHARAYLDARGVPIDRTAWGYEVLEYFDPEPTPKDLPQRVAELADELEARGAEMAFGRPKDGWKARMLAECTVVRGKDKAIDRQGYHYGRAVLRGWGLTSAKADEAMAPIERELLRTDNDRAKEARNIKAVIAREGRELELARLRRRKG